MKPLSEGDVQQIAELARLALSDAERARLGAEMTSILEHMDELAQVDTTGIEPMTHAVPMSLRLAGDQPEPSLPAALATEASADSQDGQFRVPHIIKTAGK
ncbi:MAG: Asp-tRNA(Asn)/Glu-tRNA(Gln) amidotransferase subunit GatC [Deltaproteobacteria bacterium]|nr:Asp-tRNA(Asn)/Glu-tRNA(Gln) amidotransferase subunit GatC [Deltaproteobacteria bacterium]